MVQAGENSTPNLSPPSISVHHPHKQVKSGVSADRIKAQLEKMVSRLPPAENEAFFALSHNGDKSAAGIYFSNADLGVPGVHGSRLTGGGFGGCTVTLLSRSAVPALLAAFEAEYPKRAGGRTASVFVVRPAAGAMLLQQGAGAEPLAGAPLSPQLSGVAKVTAALVLSAVAAAVIASKRQR